MDISSAPTAQTEVARNLWRGVNQLTKAEGEDIQIEKSSHTSLELVNRLPTGKAHTNKRCTQPTVKYTNRLIFHFISLGVFFLGSMIMWLEILAPSGQ